MKRDVFHAIADPTRRALVMLLAVQAMTPGAMADRFETSRQAVSKHIRVLVECGLLEGRPKGREIEYSLRAGRMREVEKWLERFRALTAARFDQLDEVLADMKRTRSGGRKA